MPQYWRQSPGPLSETFLKWDVGPPRASRLTPHPFHQIASELKDTISTRLRSARNSISVPIASTSDKVLGAALAGCELAWGMARDTAEYAANTRAGRLASGGADLALGGVEKMVEFFLPPANEESGICHCGGCWKGRSPPNPCPVACGLGRSSQGSSSHCSPWWLRG